ncbi:hypothetical protein ABIC94_001300 [Variovorax paradoxus]
MGIYANEGEYMKSKAHNAVDSIVLKEFAVKFPENFRSAPREK